MEEKKKFEKPKMEMIEVGPTCIICKSGCPPVKTMCGSEDDDRY